MTDFGKFRVPLGSLAVDATLVATMIWWGATITERLESMSRRMDTLEQVTIHPEASRRIAVIETREADTSRRLERIEQKLDQLIERRSR